MRARTGAWPMFRHQPGLAMEAAKSAMNGNWVYCITDVRAWELALTAGALLRDTVVSGVETVRDAQ